MRAVLCAAAVVGVMLGGIQDADAACSQADVAGVWASYTVGADVRGDYWLQCTLRIAPNGKFTASSSSCIASSGLKSAAEGSLTLANAATCAFKGGIVLTKGTAENFINHATLAFDKNTAEGIGTFEGGGFSFNLVRIK
ncbi:MAG TPA: hypothetical protein VL899_07525 [Alphaproteobacteria bacterium]|jgi:hypothetical protein|nr:hypothetical protein [Alphaproteobacteria bacterium]